MGHNTITAEIISRNQSKEKQTTTEKSVYKRKYNNNKNKIENKLIFIGNKCKIIG